MKLFVFTTQHFGFMLLLTFSINTHAAERHHAKDIVLAPLAEPASTTGSITPPLSYDGMSVSVLVENPDGSLSPKATDINFPNGQRFRLKIFAPRDGNILVYNTTPSGETSQNPIWKTPLKAGLESISDTFMLTGTQGEDLLHVVLQPQTIPTQDVFNWLQNIFASKKIGKTTKDIQLVTESTPQSTYMYNTSGQGGYVTIRFRHQ